MTNKTSYNKSKIQTDKIECSCGIDGYFRYTLCCGKTVMGCSCKQHEMGNCVTCGGKPTEEQRKRYYQYA